MQPRVLLVSAEPRILAEIKKTLMESFKVRIAATGEAALKTLETHGADAVVSCVGKDREAAFQAFRVFSGYAKHNNIPALMLAEAENDDESLESAAFEMGACDYCLKRGSGAALVNRLRLRILEGALACPDEGVKERTALIAEDIAINREIMSAMLDDIEGLTLDFAENGLEALEKFKSAPERYSIILMDIHMPVMDGIAATKGIRGLAHKAAQKVPIIALSASDPEDDVVRLCAKAGMNGQLEKPMERERFLEVCAQYIR